MDSRPKSWGVPKKKNVPETNSGIPEAGMQTPLGHCLVSVGLLVHPVIHGIPQEMAPVGQNYSPVAKGNDSRSVE